MTYAPAYYGGGSGASAADIIAAFKADPDLGTAGLIADAATAATEATAAVADIADVKAKTDQIGTIRSETRW